MINIFRNYRKNKHIHITKEPLKDGILLAVTDEFHQEAPGLVYRVGPKDKRMLMYSTATEPNCSEVLYEYEWHISDSSIGGDRSGFAVDLPVSSTIVDMFEYNVVQDSHKYNCMICNEKKPGDEIMEFATDDVASPIFHLDCIKKNLRAIEQFVDSNKPKLLTELI